MIMLIRQKLLCPGCGVFLKNETFPHHAHPPAKVVWWRQDGAIPPSRGDLNRLPASTKVRRGVLSADKKRTYLKFFGILIYRDKSFRRGSIKRLLMTIIFSVLFSSTPAWAAEMAVLPDNAIRDCAGREVRVDKPFSRIISLYGAHTENLLALGASDALVGVARGDDDLAGAEAKRKFSAHDGPERFLAARPDLVIVRPMIDRGYAPLMARLEQFGICVVSLQPADIEEMKVYWQILGRLTGTEAAAERMTARFNEGVAAAREIAADISPEKRVYFEAIHDRFKTFSPDAMPLFALACAGGVNVAEDAAPVRGTNIAAYSKERILSRAGEIDVYLAQAGVMNRIDVPGIINEPGYHIIKAVREGGVYLIDEKIVSRPTLRLLEGICTIGEILYPERFDEDENQRILNP